MTAVGTDRGTRRDAWPAVRVWLWLVAYLGIVLVLINTLLPVTFVDPSQASFFRADGLAAVTVLGLVGASLSARAGFPAPWSRDLSWRHRFPVPVAAGLAAGIIFLVTDLATGLSRQQVAQLGVPATDIAFPASLFVYSAAAIYVEVVFRLLPLPLLLILISHLTRGRGGGVTFWALAVATSLLEPLTQMATRVLSPLPWSLVLAQSFGLNLAQAAVFRRYGFLAAIVLRVSFYLVYHVIGASLK